MEFNKFDNEYYIMNVDGAENHPIIAWGSINFEPFLQSEPIDVKTLELPLKLIFDEPYPKEYEMADILMLASQFAGSDRLKNLFESLDIQGVQFFPAEIESNKKEKISGHYAIHIWNKFGLDKNNYEGGSINQFGKIRSLTRFSLDPSVLENIPLEKRLIFRLAEKETIRLVHQSLYEAIKAENLTGMRFWKVSEWDDNAMFS